MNIPFFIFIIIILKHNEINIFVFSNANIADDVGDDHSSEIIHRLLKVLSLPIHFAWIRPRTPNPPL
jgi:hypothetical protein